MRKGFTLIELLIVLAIIAALLTIVTPIALNAVRQANATKIASTMRNIASAAQSYVMTERTTVISGGNWLQGLVSQGYLNTNPGGDYTVSVTEGSGTEAGRITITVRYTGSAVRIDDLRRVVPEMSGSTGNAEYILTTARWW
ncbi:type II secretion system protein [Pseudothermotoga thermarum]|uniref:General secretion pathway protein G n=1 Tax=Pseudothermotoga thermarum DSM 5069 TaxID=688269 RepID=F7YUL3_9THEM|nr:prepilin-type N-terminal cleavage/methylation domain-containing protein [Pseudothermotoga thermarum]AEH51486.1 general secretion pathway protein G [Pseudothermotoga thermarum DSM 5069]